MVLLDSVDSAGAGSIQLMLVFNFCIIIYHFHHHIFLFLLVSIFQSRYLFVTFMWLLQVLNYKIIFLFDSISILNLIFYNIVIDAWVFFILKLCTLWVNLSFLFEIEYKDWYRYLGLIIVFNLELSIWTVWEESFFYTWFLDED